MRLDCEIGVLPQVLVRMVLQGRNLGRTLLNKHPGSYHSLRELLADHQEGAVIKAEESRYCDWALRWVKVSHTFVEENVCCS